MCGRGVSAGSDGVSVLGERVGYLQTWLRRAESERGAARVSLRRCRVERDRLVGEVRRLSRELSSVEQLRVEAAEDCDRWKATAEKAEADAEYWHEAADFWWGRYDRLFRAGARNAEIVDRYYTPDGVVVFFDMSDPDDGKDSA